MNEEALPSVELCHVLLFLSEKDILEVNLTCKWWAYVVNEFLAQKIMHAFGAKALLPFEENADWSKFPTVTS